MLIPSSQYYLAVIGFLIIGTGMGPIYPAIQHMAPANFGKKFAAAINKLSFNQKVTLNKNSRSLFFIQLFVRRVHRGVKQAY